MGTSSFSRALPLALLLSISAFGQQNYIGRYDFYSGFTYFNSPDINLQQRGYHLQAGYNPRTWVAVGFDYSIASGHLSLGPDLLKPSLQQQIGAQFGQLAAAGLLPPNYRLSIPVDSLTETYAAGPQLVYRHFSRLTLFVHPSIGAIHETATPRPGDAIASLVIRQLAPSGQKTDWQAFYGFGGGFEINLQKHFSLRLQADFVHNALFSDILKDERNTVRLSLGPSFHFGPNVNAR